MARMSGKVHFVFSTGIRGFDFERCFEMLEGHLESSPEMIHFGHSRCMYEKVEYTRS
jgi:hypothetical protein